MKYKILQPIRLPEGIVKPGDKPIELSAKDAAELKALGAVEEDDSGQSAAPTDPAERLAHITSAIEKMDKDNADLWLRDGKPDIVAISDITGWTITAAERNAAWESMQPKQ
jgi:hypothetical protein